MKVLLALLAAAIIGYLAWHWFAAPPAQQVSPARSQAQQTIPRPAASRSVPPPPAQPSSARPVVAKHLAPEGVYFLLQRASLTTDSGVIGFAPGTKVTLLGQTDSVSSVTDGQYRFSVPSSQLTNDLDIAESVAKSDYAAQAKIAEYIAQSFRGYEQQQRDALIAAEKEKAEKKTGQKSSPRPTPKR
jgi:hypothetical protein